MLRSLIDNKIKPEIFENPLLSNSLKGLRFLGFVIGMNQNYEIWHFIRSIGFTFSAIAACIMQLIIISQSLHNMETDPTTWASGFFTLTSSVATVNVSIQRKRLINLVNFIHEDVKSLLLDSNLASDNRIFAKHANYLKRVSLLLWVPFSLGSIVALVECPYQTIRYPERFFSNAKTFNETSNFQPVILFKIFPFREVYHNLFMGYLMPYYFLCFALTVIPVLHNFYTCLMQYIRLKVELISKHFKEIDHESNEQLLELNARRLEFIKTCVEDQVKIRWFLRQLQYSMRIPIFIDFIVFSFIICFLFYLLIVGDLTKLDCFFTFMYLTVIAVILWLYHWHATMLTECIDELCFAIYSCEWYNYPVHIQKSIRLLLMTSARPLNIQAFFVRVNLNTFLDIFRVSISYFSILRNLHEK